MWRYTGKLLLVLLTVQTPIYSDDQELYTVEPLFKEALDEAPSFLEISMQVLYMGYSYGLGIGA